MYFFPKGDAAQELTQPEDKDSQEDGAQGKRKTKRKKKIIESDVKKINIANIDQSHEVKSQLFTVFMLVRLRFVR